MVNQFHFKTYDSRSKNTRTLLLSILRTSNSNRIEQRQIWFTIEEVVYNVKIKNFYLFFLSCCNDMANVNVRSTLKMII